MTLQKKAQQELFNALAKAVITANQSTEYNGYGIDDFGYFQENINSLYEKFEIELNDNLTNRSPALEIYLTDILESLNSIKSKVSNYRKEEIYEEQRANPDAFKLNRLGYINYFMDFQMNMISNTESELDKKLRFVKNPELFKPNSSSADQNTEIPILKAKLKSRLNKVNLTVLLWWLSESELLDFDQSRDNFVKFLENNVQYFDKSNKIFVDMKDVGSLMTKLNNPTSAETNPTVARDQLLEILQKTKVPPPASVKAILVANQWKK